MRVIVTQKGPIDRHAPGDDVTGLYRAETQARLIKEGYLRRDYHKDEEPVEEEEKPVEKPVEEGVADGST